MLFLLQINHFRNVHNISVTGKRVPKPIENFDELLNRYEIGQDLVENLKNSKYESPTPIQMQAIPLMLEVKIYHWNIFFKIFKKSQILIIDYLSI